MVHSQSFYLEVTKMMRIMVNGSFTPEVGEETWSGNKRTNKDQSFDQEFKSGNECKVHVDSLNLLMAEFASQFPYEPTLDPSLEPFDFNIFAIQMAKTSVRFIRG